MSTSPPLRIGDKCAASLAPAHQLAHHQKSDSLERAFMVRRTTRDLFATETQPDLFGADAAPSAYRSDPDKVRSRLHKILAEARAAQTLPWEPTQVSLYRVIFPQMSLWLPEDEAAQLRFDFETELARLDAA